MAVTEETTKDTEAAKKTEQEQYEEYREPIQNAYSFVEGQKAVQSFAAITVEDLMDQWIERIEGKDTKARPNVLNRFRKIKEEVIATIAKVKVLSPDTFRNRDEKKDV